MDDRGTRRDLSFAFHETVQQQLPEEKGKVANNSQQLGLNVHPLFTLFCTAVKGALNPPGPLSARCHEATEARSGGEEKGLRRACVLPGGTGV